MRVLIEHFARRLFAPEDEQGDGGGMGLGLGAILAILASPGAFASIFLMGKYSTLLQWMRGEHIDAIRRSPADEYFFVVLSMTITGLVMVARWNQLFPDRRDFANLAILPIPIRNIFLANLAALVGLALVFALDVNVVSAVLFPLFVTLSYERFGLMVYVGMAHAVTVFAASLFSFFAVFGLVGILLLVTPQRVARPVSIVVRVGLVVGLLTEFYSNVFVQLFSGRLPGGAGAWLRWVPSYWFLGSYERLVGIASPRMAALGSVAWWALGGVILVSGAAYALCYQRVFRRLPETFDSMGSSRAFFRVRLPESWLRPLYRSGFERAVSSFTAKVLLRSEQHLLFVGAYLGVGLVILAGMLLDARVGQRGVPEGGLLAVPLLAAFFLVSGLRFAFDMPAAISANWVFQLETGEPWPRPRQVVRRLLLWATLPWEAALVGPWLVWQAGWVRGLCGAAATMALTVFFVDLILMGFHTIPFTCRVERDVKQMLVKLLVTLFAVSGVVPAVGGIERWMMLAPGRFGWLAMVLAAGWWGMARNREEQALVYEDRLGEAFEILRLG